MEPTISFLSYGRRVVSTGLLGLALSGQVDAQTIVGWGNDGDGQATAPGDLILPGLDVVAVAGGVSHSVALLSDHTVIAWGANEFGQATVPADLEEATAIAAGIYYSLALKGDGSVVGWGLNISGVTDVPAEVANAIAIATGPSHAVALRGDGTVIAWGSNSQGQTGVPADLRDVVGIAAGGFHSLALKADGTVVGWGRNVEGQLNVPGVLTDPIAVAAGLHHSLALQRDGKVVAWGRNDAGQCDVSGAASNAVAIAVGGDHNLALCSDGKVVGWGLNDYGQADVPGALPWAVGVGAGRRHSLVLAEKTAPFLLTQPTHQTLLVGATLELSVRAGGAVPLTYQWRKNGLALIGQAGSSLILPNAVAADSGEYSVVVSNILGAATSEVAVVTVSDPMIVAGPVSQSVLGGTNVTFSVEAVGSVPLAFQWTKDGATLVDDGRITGATAATLTLSNVWAADGGGYRCVVSNLSGAITSSEAMLTVQDPVILSPPENLSVLASSNATLFLVAEGSQPLSYQWTKNGIDLVDGGRISGATTPGLEISDSLMSDSGSYRCAVGNAWSVVTSEEAVLEVVPLLILLQPQDTCVRPGLEASLWVVATGKGPFTYQWVKDGLVLHDNGRVSGTTTAELIIADVEESDSGGYRCVVGNIYGSVVSESALLYVGIVRYAWADSPSAGPPYDSWATAAHVLQDAVDAAVDGDMVLVTNGVYATGGRAVVGTLLSRVAVDRAITVRSVNGPEATTIRGGGHCVYLGHQAVLSGFTLTGGSAWNWEIDCPNEDLEGGGIWSVSTGVVTNCIIRGNGAAWGAGAYGGNYYNCVITDNHAYDHHGSYLGTGGGGAFSARLYNCVLSGNGASGGAANSGGGAAGCRLYNCLLLNNWAGLGVEPEDSNGGGASGGRLYNCTLVGNSAGYSGGGTFSSLLYNCIVYYNNAAFNPNSGYSTLNYSCTFPLPLEGTGSITNQPAFLNAAAGNFHLAPESPCVDAGSDFDLGGGTNLSALLPWDLDGLPRPLDGNGDGTPFLDMGALEFLLPGADSNGDGIPDGWTYLYGLNPTDPNVALGNPDNDPHTTFQEWIADTDPTRAQAFLRIDHIEHEAMEASARIYFQSSSNRVYTLHCATNLNAPDWLEVTSQRNMPGSGGLDWFSDTNADPQKFYTVTVDIPP